MKLSMQTMAMAVALVFAGGAYAQQPTAPQPRDRAPAATESPEKRIEREHKAAKEACKPLKGNAQDICEKEADAKQKIAKAELKVQKKDTPENRKDLAETKAKAEYDVAMERCEDQKGEAKGACMREARMKRESAMAAVKGDARSTTGSSAPRSSSPGSSAPGGSMSRDPGRDPATSAPPSNTPAQKSGSSPKY